MYVTALLPYVILIIFLVRGVTLDGASIGLKFFFVPKWELLLTAKVWAYAAIQNFNSIGVAFGGRCHAHVFTIYIESFFKFIIYRFKFAFI